jgi:hypothetical protein
MNTRKDFERAAEIVRDSTSPITVCKAFIAFFRADNPRFDAGRFMVACGAIEE